MQGLACGDVTHDGNANNVPSRALEAVEELDASGHFRQSLEVALSLQDLEVIINDGGRAYVAPRLYISNRGWKLVFIHELADEFENELLPVGELAFHDGSF